MYAFVRSAHGDLGDYADNFARVLVASEAAATTCAGATLAAAVPG